MDIIKACRHILTAVIIFYLVSPAIAGSPIDLVVEHGPRSSPKVAVTFDLCPTLLEDEYDQELIDILIRENVPATLFMSGRWVEKHKEKARFLGSQPLFEIANHSYYHPHLLEKPDDGIRRELERTQAIIKKVTGKTPRYFRPPFGEVDERLAKLAAESGLVTIQYDLASGDPDPGLQGKTIIRRVLKAAKGGSIIVFHANLKGVHTAEIMPDIIAGLRKHGFELVTVGNMLEKEVK